MKIRMKFTKQGPVKFVGHLDTMRLFQRAIKVARIPVAYSQGFSPHSLVYFAMPLGVGVSSTGEYMDVILNDELAQQEAITPQEMMDRLNAILVEGISITDAFQVDDKMDSLMSQVQVADYDVKILVDEPKTSYEIVHKKLGELGELIIMKKGKKGVAPVDIRPLILNAEVCEEEDGVRLVIKVFAGSSQNLNPELLVKALIGEEVSYSVQVTRKELYTEDEQGYVPLCSFGRMA